MSPGIFFGGERVLTATLASSSSSVGGGLAWPWWLLSQRDLHPKNPDVGSVFGVYKQGRGKVFSVRARVWQQENAAFDLPTAPGQTGGREGEGGRASRGGK